MTLGELIKLSADELREVAAVYGVDTTDKQRQEILRELVLMVEE